MFVRSNKRPGRIIARQSDIEGKYVFRRSGISLEAEDRIKLEYCRMAVSEHRNSGNRNPERLSIYREGCDRCIRSENSRLPIPIQRKKQDRLTYGYSK
jgi:hypothetical protein